jgi:hypothetical protein
MDFNDIVARLHGAKKNGKGWTAKCPAHDDTHASLSISQGDEGRTVVRCFAGCEFDSIVQSLGLQPSDFFQSNSANSQIYKQANVIPTRNGAEPHKDFTTEAKDFTAEAKSYAEALTAERRAELANLLGLPECVLTKVVYLGWKESDQCWTFPECNGQGHIIGIQRRWRNNEKKAIADSKRGLTFTECWDLSDGPIFLPEGASDTLALSALGLSAIGRPSNQGGDDLLIQVLSSLPAKRPVVLVADFDPKADGSWPGREGAVKVAKELAAQLPGREISWILPPDGMKDVRKWVNSQQLDTTVADAWDDAGQQFLERIKFNAIAKDNPTAEPQALEALVPVSIGQLIAQYPQLKPPVIEGLLRRGEVANIIASSKAGKSWLCYGLALSMVTGRNWLDMFRCEPGRVLIVDNELHKETVAHRIPAVADAMSIQPAEYHDRIQTVCLRGRLESYNGIYSRLVRILEKGYYQLVLVDAHYRMLPQGISENDNAAMAGVYNLIDRYAEETGAGWALIHHASKGSQAEKAITDVGAGAGSQSRAADTHLILRQHEEAGNFVLEAALRSWPPVEPMSLKWVFPLWVPSDVDPAAIKDRKTKNEIRQQEKDYEGRVKIREALKLSPATSKELQRKTGLSRNRLERLLGQMQAGGEVKTTPTEKKGNKCEIYTLVNTPKRDVGD